MRFSTRGTTDDHELPPQAQIGTGVVVNNAMPRPYVYIVAVDGIDPGPSNQKNRYIYAKWEVERAGP